MSSEIDFRRLAELIKAKRGIRGLRDIAEEIGDISPSTLSRIEGQRAQDISMSTFLQLCDWLQMSPSELIESENSGDGREIEVPDSLSIELQLRAAKDLDPKTAHMLAEMFKAAVRTSQNTPEKGHGSDG